jgi:alkanesulfonate monooxygenase SsuD/methylene tetrahydromethanopterin reductase-like flavin-dependent oxidoreductase (luciferase family)
MDVGIGLPNTIEDVTAEKLAEWARRAEDAGFSTLGTIDRLVYGNIEPLIALAAAATTTSRIRLATTILIPPFRENAAYLAKLTGSVQHISGGRLVLGLAAGGREDDYQRAGVAFDARGDALERMVEQMKSIWAEGDIAHHVKEDPPKLVFGGSVDAAYRRAARHDGWIMGGGPPDAFAEGRQKLEAAWREAGREGRPYGGALAYFSLGPNAQENAEKGVGRYYEWLGEYKQGVVDAVAKDADTVKGYLQAFADAGCDELILFPASSDPEQVDLLAQAALG